MLITYAVKSIVDYFMIPNALTDVTKLNLTCKALPKKLLGYLMQ